MPLASSKLTIFDSAISPAPTTKHRRPSSLRKSGNRPCIGLSAYRTEALDVVVSSVALSLNSFVILKIARIYVPVTAKTFLIFLRFVHKKLINGNVTII